MKRLMAAGMMLAAAGAVQAADNIDTIGNLAQDGFKKFSEDLGAAFSYKAIIPAEPLGITGFDVGIEASQTTLKNEQYFDLACGGCGLDSIIVPRLHVHKGLPMNFDVGLSYASIPNSNVKLTGAELRYANVEGGTIMPAVATRATYSKMTGVDQLDFETMGLELSISKGFALFTPYGGIGYNWVTSTPNNITSNVSGLTLEEEKFNQTKYYVGLNMNLGLINFDIEADQTGDAQTYSGKVGLRF